MITAIRDLQNIHALSSFAVASYLRNTGWQSVEQIADKATVWTRGNSENEDYEILLPTRRDVRDYAVRMAEVLQTLAAAEARSQSEIYDDLTETTFDTIRIRLQSELYEDGSLPLEQGVRVVEQTRELLLAAACAAVQPRPLYPARKPAQATEYLSRVRLGQTERGSYVLAVRSAVTPRLQSMRDMQTSLFLATADESEEPFERRVTLTLARALVAAQQAATRANQTGSLEPFVQAVPLGVSANFCDALANLRLNEASQDISFGLTWSPTRPVPEQTPRRIALSSDYFPILREAARQFRDSAPLEDFELIGSVVKLEHGGDAGGLITVLGLVDSSMRRVQVSLLHKEHQMAIEAYKQEAFVTCEGELVKQGRAYVLQNPRNFRVQK